MGFLSALFGSDSDNYSDYQYQLSEHDLRRLVSRERVVSLSETEKEAVIEVLLKRRLGDGKISLRQINDTLLHLQTEHTISDVDRSALMNICKKHFSSRAHS